MHVMAESSDETNMFNICTFFSDTMQMCNAGPERDVLEVIWVGSSQKSKRSSSWESTRVVPVSRFAHQSPALPITRSPTE